MPDIDAIYCQAGSAGQILTGQRDLSTRDLIPSKTLEVSPVGIAAGFAFNNGREYGPDTLSTSTLGIQEAINALPTGGGTVTVVGTGVSATLSRFILLNKSHSTLEVDPSVTLQMPASPGWSISVTASATRSPMVVISNCSYSRVTGGKWAQITPVVNFLTAGILIGDNVSHFEYDHMSFANIGRFAYLLTSYQQGNIGAWSFIHGHDNFSDACGTTAGIDGGGYRVSNQDTVTVAHDLTVQSEQHTNCQFFGYDLGGGGSQSMTDLLIADATVTVVTIGPTPVSCGFFFEGGTTMSSKATVRNCHVSGGNLSIQILSSAGGSWSDLTFLGGTYELAYNHGIKISASAGALARLTFVGVTSKNHGQGAASQAGFAISSSGTQSGNISFVTVLGGAFTDDQTVPTQALGMVLDHSGTGGGLWDSFTFLGIDLSGNTNRALSYTPTQPVTNLTFRDCPGFNPVGIFANFFDTVNNTIGLGGSTPTPTAGVTYTCNGVDVLITATGGGGTITVKEPGGAAVFTATTLSGYRLPRGYGIAFANALPTVTAFGA